MGNNTFDVGDKVTIKPDAQLENHTAIEIQHSGLTGRVESIHSPLPSGSVIAVVSFIYKEQPIERYLFTHELELWKPVDAPAERPGFQRLLKMQMASLGETDLHKLKQEIARLRAALDEIVNLNARPDIYTAADAAKKAQRIAREALADTASVEA